MELSWIELHRVELNWIGLDWIDLNWNVFELNWSEYIWIGMCLNWNDSNKHKNQKIYILCSPHTGLLKVSYAPCPQDHDGFLWRHRCWLHYMHWYLRAELLSCQLAQHHRHHRRGLFYNSMEAFVGLLLNVLIVMCSSSYLLNYLWWLGWLDLIRLIKSEWIATQMVSIGFIIVCIPWKIGLPDMTY